MFRDLLSRLGIVSVRGARQEKNADEIVLGEKLTRQSNLSVYSPVSSELSSLSLSLPLSGRVLFIEGNSYVSFYRSPSRTENLQRIVCDMMTARQLSLTKFTPCRIRSCCTGVISSATPQFLAGDISVR